MEEKYDILLDFVYDDIKYVIYTDNTLTGDELNIYSAGIDSKGNYFEPIDTDVNLVIKAMIENYKEKILAGDL